jgi:uncharacterized protein (TIGR02599 family)
MSECLLSKKAQATAGFTLLEMTVSIAVLCLLSTLLFSILNSTNAIWSHMQGQVQSRQTGRAVLDYIASQLRVAMLPTNLNDNQNLQFVENPTQLGTTGAAPYLNPTSLFWQAPVAKNQTYGVVAEVGIFVQWDKVTNPKNPKAMLSEFQIDPATTNATGSTTPNTNFEIYPPTPIGSWTSTSWLTTSLVGSYAPSPSTSGYNYQGWVADNVVALWARCLDQYGQPITLNAAGLQFNANPYSFDSRQGYKTSSGLVKGGVPGNPTTALSALPHTVELAIVVLDPASALRLTTVPAYSVTTPGNFWTDINTFMTSSLPSAMHVTLKSGETLAGARLYTTRMDLENAW